MEECDTTPPEHLVVITSTDLYLVYDHRWWHGTPLENRPILLAWQRPGFLLRAHTEWGELIEMVIERNRDTGFEIILEETVEATGGRINARAARGQADFLSMRERCPQEAMACGKLIGRGLPSYLEGSGAPLCHAVPIST